MRLRNQVLLALLCAAPSAALAQNTVGEVFASDASIKGSVVFASGGTQVLSGSQVAAGATAAVLKLQRGGDVRICPGTNLAVATSPSGTELMLSLSTGSLETNYRVSSGSDTILTPDFRMQMIGPGVFHLAVAADSVGNTCVRPLASNDASVIVTELMGNATYQVKPGEEVVFPRGKVEGAQNTRMQGCGCPAPQPVQRAEATPPPQPPPVAAPIPAPKDVHVQMDAPFVFRGDEQQPPDLAYSIATLKTRGTGDIAIKLQPTVLSPQAVEQAAREAKKAQEARDKQLAKEQELALKEQKNQQALAAKQEDAERKAQLKKDRATAKQIAQANKERQKKDKEEARKQQELARVEQQQKEKEQAAAAEQAKQEQKKRDELARDRGLAEQGKSSEGMFKKIGSFFGRIFH